jgi:glutaredoxin 3
MARIQIYTTRFCPYCNMAKRLLAQKGATWEEINAEDDAIRADLIARTQRRTVPQIFINDAHIGGYDDLAALNQAGKLDPLLA